MRKLKAQTIQVFARNVRKLRHQTGISQELLAERGNIHWTYVARIERCEVNPSLLIIAKIAKGLNCKIKDLLEGC